jgi:hypothetical protein
MITDRPYTESNAAILYYGALQDLAGEDGETNKMTGIFTLPSGLPEGYHMYLLAECVSGDQFSDYASEPVEIWYNHAIETVDAVAPSCMEAGNIAYTYCTKCEKKFSDPVGIEEITGSIVVDPIGYHTWSEEWVIDQEATVEAQGRKHKVCLVCGEIGESAVIEKLTPTETPVPTETPAPTVTPAEAPKTGDETPLFWLFAALFLSGSVMVTAGIRRVSNKAE